MRGQSFLGIVLYTCRKEHKQKFCGCESLTGGVSYLLYQKFYLFTQFPVGKLYIPSSEWLHRVTLLGPYAIYCMPDIEFPCMRLLHTIVQDQRFIVFRLSLSCLSLCVCYVMQEW